MFALPDEIPNVADSLRAFEPQAPKPFKPILLQAADELMRLKRAASESAQALELAATLKAGSHDTEMRRDRIADEVALTMKQVAATLRALSDE